METVKISDIRSLYIPPAGSHKGQNGKLMIIGGSKLFHSASLWALKVASRLVDLVHYSSIDENLRIVEKLTEEFRDGIIVPRPQIESYISEDDCILIGPGMVRTENLEFRFQNSESQFKLQNLGGIDKITDEGMQTYYLTRYLLQKYPHKKWVIDAGALQMMEPEWIPQNAILTPHVGEFERLKSKIKDTTLAKELEKVDLPQQANMIAKEYSCTILLKGETDYIASEKEIKMVEGGNAGMTKGGTGDVLAGLVAGLYCKNDAFISAAAAAFINKKAGEDLFETKGYWFNASDLTNQIPLTMKNLLL